MVLPAAKKKGGKQRSWRNQSTTVSWVDAQEGDGAGTGFSCDGGALPRRCELAGDEQGRRKNRAREKEERRLLQSFIGRPRKQGEATVESFPRQREAKATTRAPRTLKTVAGHVARAMNTVHQYHIIAIQFETQITPKFL